MENTDIKVVSLHPGVVRTELANNFINSNILIKMLVFIIYPIFYTFTKSPLMGA